ncbi:MAG: radical SAM protein [Candidatus Thorarchaeota archaeon]|nr:radical SAM protein [Candidatus Thorarchaeota archaeon]
MKALCPICTELVEAREERESGQVYLIKNCPAHGQSKSLISKDAEYWDWSRSYDRPGTKPFRWSSEITNGCPDDCGICSAHKQHSCIGIVEVTGECNLSCPICFAAAPFGNHVSFEKVTEMIDCFVSYETNPEILQISGGEPTLHPEIVDIVKYAKGLGIEDVVVSTNGLRLLDDGFMESFARADPVVYLQFDTLKPEVSKAIRGRDLVSAKLEAVERCKEQGLTTVLVPTIVRGLNDDEIGDIIDFGISQEKVFGINYQPAALTGRSTLPDAQTLTIDEVLKKIESQTNGTHQASHFRPIPCPHPHCTAISYMIVNGDEIIPLTTLVDVDDYVDYAKDRTLVSKSTLVDAAFESLFSTSAVPGTDKNVATFCEACGLEVPEFLKKSVKTISVHAFMDRNNYQLERAQKCCIHLIRPDGKMIPFCNYNMFHRNRGAK